MEGQSKEEYISFIRRKSSGFSRGVSKYRGVARHHKNGKWEARIGRVFDNKYLYLGTYATQEEAAMAYDKAAIEHRGLAAVTNFDISRYLRSLGQSPRNPDPNQPPPPDMDVAGEPTGGGANPPPRIDMLDNARERTSLAPPPPEPQRNCFPDDVQTYFGGWDGAAADGYDVIFGDLDSLEPTVFDRELDS
ncbi:unnamed protein product [Spirodela intermedia]|uniref:AP2/ERF domain-containing protein n=1 Tax=Spirodela intermedia TaxID=51605 RepID=A0A7I8JJC5_SPIIN|nr:unnamed protein product [Spirodela intermedia]CAA6670268.1 unnamed protein product [Spirodela intermedia]